MKKYIENDIHILEPDEGLWLFNGDTYSDKVYLGKNSDGSEWTEVEWDGTYPEEQDEVS